MRTKNLSEDEKLFILKLIPTTSYEEIVQLFDNIFGRKISIHTAKRIGRIHKVYREKNFKGHVPWNKDKKFPGQINSGCFKKGHKINTLPIGSEHIDKQWGRITIKTKNGWRLKQRYLYEQYHGRKLAGNEKVIFLDGDKNNFEKDNLVAINNSILAFMKCNGTLKILDPILKKEAIKVSTAKHLLKELRCQYGEIKHRTAK